jgi:hypothetical protein
MKIICGTTLIFLGPAPIGASPMLSGQSARAEWPSPFEAKTINTANRGGLEGDHG